MTRENGHYIISENSLMKVIPCHYANTPMQYTAIFHGCKNVHFQLKLLILHGLVFVMSSKEDTKHTVVCYLRVGNDSSNNNNDKNNDNKTL